MPALGDARRSSSIALAVRAMIGIGRAPASCSARADAARGLKPVEAGHLDVHQDDFETRRLAARRRLAERRRLAPVMRPHDLEAEPRSAFWAIVALISLSSASSARVGRPAIGGASVPTAPGGRKFVGQALEQ